MSGSLSRSRIMTLFAELSEELERKGLRGHIYIVGGAALIAGYGRKRSTHDVDARIVYEKRGVSEAANALARKHDLPVNWLNENATLFMPHKDDTQATTVFNSPSLVVTGASARHHESQPAGDGAEQDRRAKDSGRPADRKSGGGNRGPGSPPGRRARPGRQPKGREPESKQSGLRALMRPHQRRRIQRRLLPRSGSVSVQTDVTGAIVPITRCRGCSQLDAADRP